MSRLHLNTATLVALLVFLVATLAPQHPAAAAASTWYVNAAATGANDGTSWPDAYTDLQSALAAATSGDEAWVARGIYKPTAGNDATVSFVLKDGVAVYGGFAGGETSRTQRDAGGNPTILSGDLPASTSHHVVYAGSGGPATVLDGFKVRHGCACEGASNGGGGMFIDGGNPTVANVTFSSNAGWGAGAGMYVKGGSPTLTGVIFAHNRADGDGGGLYSDSGSSPSLTNVTFKRNVAESTFGCHFGGDGGGAFFGGGSPTLTNVTFARNSAGSGGGAYFLGGTPDLANVTMFDNSACGRGVGISISGGCATVTYATLSGNATGAQGGIYATGDASLTVRESILWDSLVTDGTPSVTFGGRNLVQGGCPAGTTCTPANVITADPKLGGLADNGGPVPTIALASDSPAIDTGTRATCVIIPADARGVLRPQDGNSDGKADCDLGAFEYVPPPPVVGFAAATSSGTEAMTTVTISVNVSPPAPGPVAVHCRVADGTAKSPSDYRRARGTLTIPAFTAEANLTFTVINDRFDEPNETVILTLSSPTGAALGTATHTYTILDDDPRVLCRGRLPTIVGTPGNDRLTGTNGNDVIVGLGGADTIDGNGGDDVICGGRGNDVISGGDGNDVLIGEAGNDALRGDGGADLLFGRGGKDGLAGGAGAGDFCDGGPGVDSLLPDNGCESTSAVP